MKVWHIEMEEDEQENVFIQNFKGNGEHGESHQFLNQGNV